MDFIGSVQVHQPKLNSDGALAPGRPVPPEALLGSPARDGTPPTQGVPGGVGRACSGSAPHRGASRRAAGPLREVSTSQARSLASSVEGGSTATGPAAPARSSGSARLRGHGPVGINLAAMQVRQVPENRSLRQNNLLKLATSRILPWGVRTRIIQPDRQAYPAEGQGLGATTGALPDAELTLCASDS